MRINECKTLKDKQDFAMEYHGIECQQRKLVEGVNKLNEAINDYETRKTEGLCVDYKEIMTELAEVRNLTEQIQAKYLIDSIELQQEKRYKINRHFREMEKEINDNRNSGE